MAEYKLCALFGIVHFLVNRQLNFQFDNLNNSNKNASKHKWITHSQMQSFLEDGKKSIARLAIVLSSSVIFQISIFNLRPSIEVTSSKSQFTSGLVLKNWVDAANRYSRKISAICLFVLIEYRCELWKLVHLVGCGHCCF